MVKLEVSGPMIFNYSTGELEPIEKAPKFKKGQKIYAYGYAMSCQIFAIVNPDTREMVEVGRPDNVDEYSLDCYFSPTSKYDSYIRPISKKFGIGFYYAEGEPLFSDEVIEESLKRANLIYKMRDERKKAAEENSRKNKDELLRKYDFLTPGTDYKTASGNLRALLKKEFPGVKFSVRKSRGNAVYIAWTNGPKIEDVDRIASMFKDRHFNGMEDYEEITSSDFNELFGGLGYVFCDRKTVAEPVRPAEPSEPLQTGADGLQIVDYSEKAIAVIGETKAVKDRLKELGGRFNAKLSCGPGWIFSKTKKNDLKAAFNI